MAKASFIRSHLLARHGITGIFSLRNGGVSPPPFDSQNFGPDLGDSDSFIEKNLLGLMQSASLTCLPHQANQVHKTELLWCRGEGKMHSQQVDILMTNRSNTAVAVRVADCLPVLLADPESGIVAAVHAGWRGTAAGIVRNAVEAMLKHGAQHENLLAALGPCIGSCCFAIGKDTAEALKKSTAGANDCLIQTSEIHADLAAINVLQLIETGLKKSHIEVNKACTACQTENFFSFRRDGKQSGRQLAVVAIPSST